MKLSKLNKQTQKLGILHYILVSCKFVIINIDVKITDIVYLYFAKVRFTRDGSTLSYIPLECI